MVYKSWIPIFIGICLWIKLSSSLLERCNLNVQIDYSDGQRVEPAVICSSDCGITRQTFYRYDETLAQEYNSLVRVSYDDQGNVICNIEVITQDILKGEIWTNSASEYEAGSEGISISTSYLYYPIQVFAPNFNEMGESTPYGFQIEDSDVLHKSREDESQSPGSQVSLPDTENAKTKYQSSTSPKDDKSTENDKKTFLPYEEVTRIKMAESGTGFVTPHSDLQNESQKSFVKTDKQKEITSPKQHGNGETNQSALIKCSKGWTLNPDSKMCYYVTYNTMNWFDASVVCAKLGGKLSIFHSQKEFNFVKENVIMPESSWIGLEYTLSNNLEFKTWRWIDGSYADFTYWARGEPSSGTSLWEIFWDKDNCVEMKKSESFAWNDERCTNFRRVLCSKEAASRPRTTCPESWLRNGNKCYHFCKKELPEELIVLQCSSHADGVKLFTPEDNKEMEFISENLKEQNMSYIWLGIKDTQENGDFRTPEGELQTFFNWDINEPSKSFLWFSAKDCVKMSSERKMKREKCDQVLPFVCYFDL